MNNEEAYKEIVSDVAAFIRMTWVVDDDGDLLSEFAFRPQTNQLFLDLSMNKDSKCVPITTDDVRVLCKKWLRWCDLSEKMNDDYCKISEKLLNKLSDST